MKIPIFLVKYHQNGGCSWAMLVSGRGNHETYENCPWFMTLPYKSTRKFMKAGRLPSMTQVEENWEKITVGWWRWELSIGGIYDLYIFVINPRHSMYGTATCIYHVNQRNVGKYTIHWVSGWWCCCILFCEGVYRLFVTFFGPYLLTSMSVKEFFSLYHLVQLTRRFLIASLATLYPPWK